VSYSTTEVGSFTPLNSGSLRSTAPESEPHDVFRAGSPQPLTAGYTHGLVSTSLMSSKYKKLPPPPPLIHLMVKTISFLSDVIVNL
ncbi:MAG: hypothetical protein ACTSWV_04985, partial [Candidatus Asgardarchaeia archaeon]